MYKILISILFLLLSCSALARTNTANTDYSKPIIVKSSSPKIVIRLPSNRTTGFAWFLLSNKDDLVKPVRAKYQAPKKTMPGAPGVSIWTFKIDDDAFDVPRILHITMIYARPWDLKGATRKVITVITH